MSTTLQRRLRNLGWYFLVWTLVAIYFFSQGLVQKAASHDPNPWWHYLLSWLAGAYISALLTPVILWLAARVPISRRNWVRPAVLHLLLSIVFSLLSLAVESFVLPMMHVFPDLMKTPLITFIVLLTIGFHQNVLTYWAILAIHYGTAYYRKYQEREKQALRLERDAAELKERLTRAQLSALKMQLQPHFLFNTLNAIMVLVRQQRGREAEETLGLLGDLLRCVLDDVEAQEVPLRRELHYLELYLSIEQVRFQDRLRIEISAEPAILEAAVPHMGLQPIVENAIRHGIGRSSSAGRIRIEAVRDHEALVLTVRDDGPGLPPSGVPTGHGIGLANTRARLQQLYGEAGQLAVENEEPRGTAVTMRLPFHIAEGHSEEIMEVHAVNDADRG
ncbi:MAG TPA: histidine kinase [Bryobacteraceae bacterium]|nr:histidine kinase [Bryobacteraceae bacterium]